MTRAAFFLALSAVLSVTSALPLQKRIAQTIADSTTDWVQACDAAGGGEQCQPVSQTAFMTLLAAAGPCDQQNAADQMIDLAKQLNNDANMIKFAQIFVQQPRNSPDSTQVPYCEQAPANSELNGLFQCQFDGTTDSFTGLQTGASGTVPFGLSSLAVARSCPASPSSGVTDGAQLTDTTQDPGLSNIASIGTSSGTGGSSNSTASTTAASSASSSAAVVSSAISTSTADAGSTDASVATATATATGATTTSTSSFALANGQAAQQLNAQFATLTADSSCTAGQNACVGSSFAQCVNGSFELSDCGAANGVTCAALPLVNSQGTSITCVTQAEAVERIADTGATGGLTGSD